MTEEVEVEVSSKQSAVEDDSEGLEEGMEPKTKSVFLYESFPAS